MSDEEVRDQLVTLLLAGHETTATALAWTFDLLLRHPERAGAPARRDRGGDGDEYMRAVISESLRLRPVIPLAGRRTAHAGSRSTATLLPPGRQASAQRSISPLLPFGELYPSPTARTGALSRRRQYRRPCSTGSRFGGGVRRCLGASFAEFEMRIVLQEVLGRCELQAASKEAERITRRNICHTRREAGKHTRRARRATCAERPHFAQAAGKLRRLWAVRLIRGRPPYAGCHGRTT